MSKTKDELVKYLVENYADGGTVDLTDLNFGDYSVDTSKLRTRGNLYQSRQSVSDSLYQDEQRVSGILFQERQNVEGSLYQNEQEVGYNLIQNNQKVSADLHQSNQKVGGDLYQDNIKTMTKKDIEYELGYKIIIEEEEE